MYAPRVMIACLSLLLSVPFEGKTQPTPSPHTLKVLVLIPPHKPTARRLQVLSQQIHRADTRHRVTLTHIAIAMPGDVVDAAQWRRTVGHTQGADAVIWAPRCSKESNFIGLCTLNLTAITPALIKPALPFQDDTPTTAMTARLGDDHQRQRSHLSEAILAICSIERGAMRPPASCSSTRAPAITSTRIKRR